jgi:hypothetical protein
MIMSAVAIAAATASAVSVTPAHAEENSSAFEYKYQWVPTGDNYYTTRGCDWMEVHGWAAGPGSQWYFGDATQLCFYSRSQYAIGRETSNPTNLEGIDGEHAAKAESYFKSILGGPISGTLSSSCPYNKLNPPTKSAEVTDKFSVFHVKVYQIRPDTPEPYLVDTGRYFKPAGSSVKWSGGSSTVPNNTCSLPLK